MLSNKNKNTMKMKLCAAAVAVAAALAPSLARADVVVTGNTPPPAQPAPVVVQPQQQPATNTTVVQPVESAPARRTTTTVVERENRNYMSTIFVSALMGGLAGVLVGGALYFLVDDQTHAPRIGYWAAGGVLVGTGVGLAQVMVQESRADRAVSMLPSDPAPTFRLALFRTTF
jgi:hypothetical protein